MMTQELFLRKKEVYLFLLASWHIYEHMKQILLFQCEFVSRKALLLNGECLLLFQSLFQFSVVEIHCGAF